MTDDDVLQSVLADNEVQESLRVAMKELALTSPLVFLRHFVMPRQEKLSRERAPSGYAECTPAEEAYIMDVLTDDILHKAGAIDENGEKLPPGQMCDKLDAYWQAKRERELAAIEVPYHTT